MFYFLLSTIGFAALSYIHIARLDITKSAGASRRDKVRRSIDYAIFLVILLFSLFAIFASMYYIDIEYIHPYLIPRTGVAHLLDYWVHTSISIQILSGLVLGVLCGYWVFGVIHFELISYEAYRKSHNRVSYAILVIGFVCLVAFGPTQFLRGLFGQISGLEVAGARVDFKEGSTGAGAQQNFSDLGNSGTGRSARLPHEVEELAALNLRKLERQFVAEPRIRKFLLESFDDPDSEARNVDDLRDKRRKNPGAILLKMFAETAECAVTTYRHQRRKSISNDFRNLSELLQLTLQTQQSGEFFQPIISDIADSSITLIHYYINSAANSLKFKRLERDISDGCKAFFDDMLEIIGEDTSEENPLSRIVDEVNFNIYPNNETLDRVITSRIKNGFSSLYHERQRPWLAILTSQIVMISDGVETAHAILSVRRKDSLAAITALPPEHEGQGNPEQDGERTEAEGEKALDIDVRRLRFDRIILAQFMSTALWRHDPSNPELILELAHEMIQDAFHVLPAGKIGKILDAFSDDSAEECKNYTVRVSRFVFSLAMEKNNFSYLVSQQPVLWHVHPGWDRSKRYIEFAQEYSDFLEGLNLECFNPDRLPGRFMGRLRLTFQDTIVATNLAMFRSNDTLTTAQRAAWGEKFRSILPDARLAFDGYEEIVQDIMREALQNPPIRRMQGSDALAELEGVRARLNLLERYADEF